LIFFARYRITVESVDRVRWANVLGERPLGWAFLGRALLVCNALLSGLCIDPKGENRIARLNRPKREQRIAQGFSPGNTYPKQIALKALQPAARVVFSIGIPEGLPHELKERPTAGRYSQRQRSSKTTRWLFKSSRTSS